MLTWIQLYEEYEMCDTMDYYNEIPRFSPCFFVDFDHQHFASLYPEMIRFENYVPAGWTGVHRDFRSEISEEERYWVADGQNLFEKHKRGF